MLMWRPKLLVLDEPLANLDINAQQLFLQDLKFIIKSVRYPLAVILSSQALHEIESVADNIVFIKQGQTLVQRLAKSIWR
jgi:ABC-2 type transport system ATP-binding protein